jgi:antitoxin component YwqK of YwqJK toxin-antitoxin module
MNLKWCAFTGAIMLVFVAATFYHEEVSKDPPGVVSRWWDGSLQSVEVKHSNGKLANRMTFGDDGVTVLTLEEWDWAGVLTHSKIRRKDGRVEEKMFSEDGKTVSFYKLWNGDELTYVIERKFHPNGKLASETIMTEDGLVAAEQRMFEENGNLRMERRVLDNADQATDMYANGKLMERSIFKANGDSWNEQFDENGNLHSRSKNVRLDGSSVFETFFADGKVKSRSEEKVGKSLLEQFDANGKVVLRRENGSTSMINVTVFEGEKVKLRQYLKGWQLARTEEVSTATGFTTRAIDIEYSKPNKQSFQSPTPIARRVELYRADGTLERVKLLKDDGAVAKTTEYDSTGKTVTSEKEGGEAEKIDEKLLQDATTANGGQ